MIGQGLAPLGQAIGGLANSARGWSERYLGDGATTALGATLQAGAEIAGVLGGARLAQGAFDRVVGGIGNAAPTAELAARPILPGSPELVGPLSPSQLARSWQGSGAYPGVDSYSNVALKQGTVVVGATPGQSPYYTTVDAFKAMDGTAIDYYQKLQVSPNLTSPAYPPYRSGVTFYEVVDDGMPAATGQALANSQFGAGGAQQVFIPGYQSLKPLYTVPFKQ